ncbi:MAG: ATP-binding cassette domain-containing protein [Verrucomicrobia bacterium]|nr:ATP-binding cassette domain-containing protein [Verrucomicrobiota bacterium]
MTGITKRFGEAVVLRDVQFEMCGGEVHVLAGENGADKSTLIKILAGVHADFEGRIEIAGREVRPRTPLETNPTSATGGWDGLGVVILLRF